MQAASITVGTTATKIPMTITPRFGMRLLARTANTGTVYLGIDNTVTSANGVIVPQGDPGTLNPFTVPAEHFTTPAGSVWIIGSASGQVVDWSAD